MKQNAWDVLLKIPEKGDKPDSVITVVLPHTTVTAHLVKSSMDYDFYLLDTVFYDVDCDREYVRRSLIDHDGYPSNIVVDRGK